MNTVYKNGTSLLVPRSHINVSNFTNTDHHRPQYIGSDIVRSNIHGTPKPDLPGQKPTT